MGFTPALKPNLIIQNEIKDDWRFKTTSALVMNSLFRHYKPQLAQAPELAPSLTPAVQPDLEIENNTAAKQPGKQPEFFNTLNIAKVTEGIGDLMSAFVSGDFSDNPASVDADNHRPINQRQATPSAFFSKNNKLMPSPMNSNKNKLSKKHEEESKFRPKR